MYQVDTRGAWQRMRRQLGNAVDAVLDVAHAHGKLAAPKGGVRDDRLFRTQAGPGAPLGDQGLLASGGAFAGRAAAIPKPYVELVISLGDGHWWSAGEHATPFAGGWITPIQTGPRFSRSLGQTRFVAARLHPDAARLLFGPLPLGDGPRRSSPRM